jgi:hypothetical protein
MVRSFRSIAGLSLLSVGAMCAIILLESIAYAGGGSCTDNGCKDRGGATRTCSGTGGCTIVGDHACTCSDNPLDSQACYCKNG